MINFISTKKQLSFLSRSIYHRLAFLMLIGVLTGCGQTGELERPPCAKMAYYDAI